MSLLEAWDTKVTRREAVMELLAHDADLQEFYAECGFKQGYLGSEVLIFLGY
jgi:hypothetical protein